MRIALVIVSVLSMLIGVGPRLTQPVKRVPPDYPIIHAIREINQLPAAQRDKILPLVEEGRSNLKRDIKRLETSVNFGYVGSFVVGAAGLAFAMGRWSKRA